MRRITDMNEIRELEKKLVVKLFSNFAQLVEDVPDRQAHEGIHFKAYHLSFPYKSYDGEENKVYDMGSGYIMIISKQTFHKSANKILGVGKADFEETISIYRIIN
jgi:hypothetical protein